MDTSTDVQQLVLVKEEAPEEQSAGEDQKDPEHIHIKEEQEEKWTSLEGEQLHLEEKTDAARFPFTLASIKSEDDEEKPLFSQLHQQQVEDKEVPTSSSAHQMTEETGGTSRNQDLNSHEQTSESSETEMSGDDEEGDDVNLDSELSDSGSETGEEDSDWNESRSSDTHVRTVNKSFSCPECGKQFVHKRSLQKHVRVSGHSAIRSSSCLVKKKCVGVKQHVDSCKRVQKELKSFSCDDCGKRFSALCDLNVHTRVHTGDKSFACETCGRRFSQKAALNRHMRVHTGEKPFACELCEKIFSSKTQLNSHIRVHTGEKPFPCELCDKIFCYKTALNYHMKAHTGEKPFACDLCEKRFSSKTQLNSHMRVHTGEKPFACELCGKKFAHKVSLNYHIRVHTGEQPFACKLCDKRFDYKTALNRHMRVHTGEKPFACKLCDKRFGYKTALNRHMKAHTGEKPFACELCEKIFSTKTQLNSHMRFHTGEKPFACELCGKKFAYKVRLNSHISVHTGQKPFACELCGRRFREKYSLNVHMRFHRGEKPFACGLCGQRYGYKTALNYHMRVHTGEKPFACKLCDKRFGYKTALNRHMKAHTGEKPFACKLCDKRYGYKTHLNSHMRVHKGEKPFACELCDKRFGYKTALNRHMKAHTGEKPFACKLCDKRFGYKTALNRHMKAHTGEKPFACKLCDKRYGYKTHLNSHMRVHKGEKPFACELCDKRFGYKTALNYHMRVHTGEKPFACKLCDKRFGYKTALNRHMKAHTGEKPFACKLCGKKFAYKVRLNSHIRVHTGQKPFACELCGRRFIEKYSLNVHMRFHTEEKPFACGLCGQRFGYKTALNYHMRVHTREKPSSIHNLSPLHLFNLFHIITPTRSLRTSSPSLSAPRTRLCTMGARAFSHSAPKLWNTLPPDLRIINSFSTFKSQLKTHMFRLAYSFSFTSFTKSISTVCCLTIFDVSSVRKFTVIKDINVTDQQYIAGAIAHLPTHNRGHTMDMVITYGLPTDVSSVVDLAVHLYPRSCSFGHYPKLVTISEGNVDRTVNRELSKKAKLSLHHDRPVQHPHHCRCTSLPIDLTLHLSLTREQDPEILKLLQLEQDFISDLEKIFFTRSLITFTPKDDFTSLTFRECSLGQEKLMSSGGIVIAMCASSPAGGARPFQLPAHQPPADITPPFLGLAPRLAAMLDVTLVEPSDRNSTVSGDCAGHSHVYKPTILFFFPECNMHRIAEEQRLKGGYRSLLPAQQWWSESDSICLTWFRNSGMLGFQPRFYNSFACVSLRLPIMSGCELFNFLIGHFIRDRRKRQKNPGPITWQLGYMREYCMALESAVVAVLIQDASHSVQVTNPGSSKTAPDHHTSSSMFDIFSSPLAVFHGPGNPLSLTLTSYAGDTPAVETPGVVALGLPDLFLSVCPSFCGPFEEQLCSLKKAFLYNSEMFREFVVLPRLQTYKVDFPLWQGPVNNTRCFSDKIIFTTLNVSKRVKLGLPPVTVHPDDTHARSRRRTVPKSTAIYVHVLKPFAGDFIKKSHPCGGAIFLSACVFLAWFHFVFYSELIVHVTRTRTLHNRRRDHVQGHEVRRDPPHEEKVDRGANVPTVVGQASGHHLSTACCVMVRVQCSPVFERLPKAFFILSLVISRPGRSRSAIPEEGPDLEMETRDAVGCRVTRPCEGSAQVEAPKGPRSTRRSSQRDRSQPVVVKGTGPPRLRGTPHRKVLSFSRSISFTLSPPFGRDFADSLDVTDLTGNGLTNQVSSHYEWKLFDVSHKHWMAHGHVSHCEVDGYHIRQGSSICREQLDLPNAGCESYDATLCSCSITDLLPERAGHDGENVQQLVLVKQEAPEEQSAGVDQKDPEHIHMKEEQEENWTSLEGEQLHLEEKTDAARVPFTLASIKSEDDEEKPLFSQLHQQQVEDKEVPTSSSAHQMTAETGGRADTSRNQDLNPHEQTSDSSETEMSGDDEEGDDVNLDSELSDSGSETGEEDSDWNESKSSDSHVRTVNKSFSCPECGKQFLHKRSLQKHVRVSGHSAIRSSSCWVKKKGVRVKQHVDSCKRVQKELKSFSCDDCGERFSAMCDSNIHMRVHTGEKPFACETCGRRFSRKGNLNSHMRVHTGEKPFACETCGRRFSRKGDLNIHTRVHTGEKPFACETCGRRFSRMGDLNSHMRVHTGEKPFACELCGKKFAHKLSLNIHLRVHTGEKPFPCELCDKRFSLKTQLNSHMRVHTGEKPFACETCGRRFSRKGNLNSHMRVHTGEKPFACELCGQRFNEKNGLNRHMRFHRGDKPFVCELCGQIFRKKYSLNSHMRVHTGEKPFACELCGRRFRKKYRLNSHMRVHTGEKPFACELCGRRFSQKGSLNSHMRFHRGEKPFACGLCGQRYGYKTALIIHMRVHTGEKPFSCELCGQTFKYKTTLNYHVRAHTGEKPFACGLCGQRYAYKTTLNYHMRVHTGEKPFACGLCGQRYGYKTALIYHMRVHTREKPCCL
ncbi:uncharacterized protein [Nothobranchius furzeri]|uniref:uncharacterized protein n=1 Tax=Nothobranchius furzeri TaxID=105023 RepID=UPI003904CBFA